jgi:hypothetical protein
MTEGRLKKLLKRWILDILAEEGAPPAWRFLEGVIVKVHSSNKVDVVFKDPDNRLKSKNNIDFRAPVGDVIEVTAGTKVVVGFLACDERYPVAFASQWLTGGSLKKKTTTATDRQDLIAPEVGLGRSFSDPLADAIATKADLKQLLFQISIAANLADLKIKLVGVGWELPAGAPPNHFCSSSVKASL